MSTTINSGGGVNQTTYTGSTGGTEGTEGTNATTGAGASGSTGNVPDALSGLQELFATSVLRAATERASEGSLDRLQNGEQKLDEAVDVIKNFLSNLRDDDLLGKLLIEFAAMGRQQALDNRLAAREAAKGDLMNQAAETKEAAGKMLAGAIVSAVITIAASMISIAGAVGQMKEAVGAHKQSGQAFALKNEANQMTLDAKTMDTSTGAAKLEQAELEFNANKTMNEGGKLQATSEFRMTASQLNAQVVNAISQMVNAVGGMVKGSLDASAKMDEATGQESAAEAQEEQANAEIAQKVVQELDELIRKSIEFLKQMQEAETNLMANMTRV